jgi:predicted trehalose synthase
MIDSEFVAKLIRQIDVGPNPDVEVPEGLAAAGFRHAPTVAAPLDVALADGTATMLIAHDASHTSRAAGPTCTTTCPERSKA